MPVRIQLALWNVLIFAIVLGGLSLMLRDRVRRNLTEGIQKELQGRVDGIVTVLHEEDMPQFGPPPEPIRRLTSDVMPRVFDETGRYWGPSIEPYTPFDADAVKKATRGGRTGFSWVRKPEQAPLLVYTAVAKTRGSPTQTLILQAAQSTVNVEKEVALLTGVLIAQIPLALGLVGLGALFLTNRALRPVAIVTQTAAEIEATDLSRRLPVKGQDEFARLAATLNGMLARLEKAFELQRRFVADASHELKSPLTVIKANSSLTLSDPTLPEHVRLSLKDIDIGTDRTIKLVQDLLLLARSDSGDFAPRIEPFPIRPLLEQLVRQMARVWPEGPTVCIKASQDDVLHADPEQIRRLLTNLIENAIRHTPTMGEIELQVEQRGETMTLIVRDTGIGIAPEDIPRLGERFFRADASRTRDTGGTGLGLSICKAIAGAHGGHLEISSAPGEGTTVIVILPQTS